MIFRNNFTSVLFSAANLIFASAGGKELLYSNENDLSKYADPVKSAGKSPFHSAQSSHEDEDDEEEKWEKMLEAFNLQTAQMFGDAINGRPLRRMQSTLATRNMIDHDFDYKRVLSHFGIEDDGKSIEEINSFMKMKLKGKNVKAMLFSMGSAGDVLPLVHYVKHISEKLPWIEFSFAVLNTQAHVKQVVEDMGIEVKLIMEKTRPNGYHQSVVSSKIAKSDLVNSSLRYLDKAQLVFYWDLYRAFPGIVHYMKSKGSRHIFVGLHPSCFDTYVTEANRNQQIDRRTAPDMKTTDAILFENPVLLSRSGAFLTQHYPNDTLVVGNFRVEPKTNDFKPSEDLQRFLDINKNKKMILFSLGSMSNWDRLGFAHEVESAQDGFCQTIKRLGSRNYAYIWHNGMAKSERISYTFLTHRNCHDNVFLLQEYVPHSWIFPLMSLVIHHGGSGTTHETLFSGVPAVVCPIIFTSDQPSFAKMVDSFGYGRGLDSCDRDSLPGAVKLALEDPYIQERVKYGQSMMKKENEKDVGTVFVAKLLQGNVETLLKKPKLS